MTEIKYRDSAARFAVSFCGHAGYAECGKDIVCAGISVLASELMLACEQAQCSGEITNYRCVEGSGYVKLSFFYGEGSFMRRTVRLILACLRLLEKEYGSYLRVVAQSPIQSQSQSRYNEGENQKERMAL